MRSWLLTEFEPLGNGKDGTLKLRKFRTFFSRQLVITVLINGIEYGSEDFRNLMKIKRKFRTFSNFCFKAF